MLKIQSDVAKREEILSEKESILFENRSNFVPTVENFENRSYGSIYSVDFERAPYNPEEFPLKQKKETTTPLRRRKLVSAMHKTHLNRSASRSKHSFPNMLEETEQDCPTFIQELRIPYATVNYKNGDTTSKKLFL